MSLSHPLQPIYLNRSRLVCLILLFFAQSFDRLRGDIVLSDESKSSNASKLIEQAETAVREGELGRARGILAKLANEPNQFHPEIVLADLLLANGQKTLARATLEKFSSGSGARIDLFLACAKLALAEQRWFDAFVHAQLAANQPMPDTWSEPFKKYTKVELDKILITSVAARGNWAHVKELTSKYKRAKETDPQILEYAAQAEFYLENAKDAFEIFSLLAKEQVGAINPYTAMAKLFESQGNAERAEKFYRTALEGAPLDGSSVLEFARWLIWQNRAADALSELEKLRNAIEFAKERDYLAGLAHRLEKDHQTAKEIFESLYAQEPISFAFANQLALVLIESKDESDQLRALEIAQQNLRANRASTEAWSTLGWIQLNRNDLEQSQKSLAIAAQAGQVSRDTAYYIAQLKLKLGETEASQALQNQAEQADGPFFYAGR